MNKFKEIFEGNNNAYGQMVIQPGAITDKGKQKAKAFIKRDAVTDKLWQDHLKGIEPALGVIPINEQNMCKWGCIDVDDYKLDLKNIAASIKSHKFPLVLFRSKSGGAHLFLFCDKFISAALLQSKLIAMADALGFGGSEIFPKQTELLAERGDVGNFLNLPYHGGIRGMRYALDENGEAITESDFYIMYDKVVLTETQIDEIKVKKSKTIKKEVFEDGPPCLNKLADEGFGEGSRNNALFNIGVFHKQATPDTWQDAVMASNQKYFDPPLPFKEVNDLIGSLNKRGYDKYRCKDQPICGVCNPAKCRTKKFGVGYDEEQMAPLKDLQKYCSEPATWILTVGDKRVQLKSQELHNPNLFAVAVMEQANLVVPILKGKDWREVYLKPLFAGEVAEIEPLESLQPKKELRQLLLQYTMNRTRTTKLEELVNGKCYVSTEENHAMFQVTSFLNFLKKNAWDMNKKDTGKLLQELDLYEEEIRPKVLTKDGEKRPRCIKVKLGDFEEGAVQVETTYDEHPF
jgi:hypothetical protein